MRFSQLGVVAALAVADAFLLPPEISAADTDIINTLPFEDAVTIDGRVMEINCPGCPVVNDIADKMHPTQVDSVLKLDFRLVHDELDRLYLNNLQIYPMDPSSTNFMEPLTAPQMIKNDDNTWEYSSTPKLGYAISVERPVASQGQLDLISIHIEIIEVADVFLPSIPAVEIKLLETQSHKLMIGDASIGEPKVARPETGVQEECRTILCKWRAIVADRLSKLKGCGSKKPAVPAIQSIPAHEIHGHHGRPHAHGKHPEGPHRPFRHHRHRHGGITRFLKGIVMHVVIPVLIGVMVGITASLLGMVVGHIVIFVWRILFRRNTPRQQYTKVQQEESAVEDVTDETKGFMEHQGPPPVYEEVVIVESASE
ncbi:hypothetical protein BGZ57DRAFT_855331 [Hyaloscypha finlandica]|nr:hypothetical protein BGZ57DRAFT_855331 [Hyaloscypha finlandica]